MSDRNMVWMNSPHWLRVRLFGLSILHRSVWAIILLKLPDPVRK